MSLHCLPYKRSKKVQKVSEIGTGKIQFFFGDVIVVKFVEVLFFHIKKFLFLKLIFC